MFVWRNSTDLKWWWGKKLCDVVALALLFRFLWWSKCRLWFVQVDQTYQPCHIQCSLPPYCPLLATSTISPNNIVNTICNGQWFKTELCATSSWLMLQMKTVFHMTMSSSEWRQDRLGSRKSPSPWGIGHSVSYGSGMSLPVRVRVQSQLLPNWWSGSYINQNCRHRYSLMVNSQHIWIG